MTILSGMVVIDHSPLDSAVAAAPVGFKELAATLVPDAEWLIGNARRSGSTPARIVARWSCFVRNVHSGR